MAGIAELSGNAGRAGDSGVVSAGQAETPIIYKQRIVALIEADGLRMRALHAARALNLPDGLIAAGFIRNMVWDNIFDTKTDINDIDVIYFCRSDISKERDLLLEKRLRETEPSFPWSVKNQARMHVKHGDPPYQNTMDAMRHWPEKQTCIGATLDSEGKVLVRHCFDLSLQFSGNIDRNAARTIEIFKHRVSSKDWLNIWPALRIKP